MPDHEQLHIVRKSAIICCAWFLCVFVALMPAAAQVKFYTYVNHRSISETEVLQVKYIIEGAKNIKQFRHPAFADFSVERAFDEPYIPKQDPGDVQPKDSYSKVAILAPRRAGKFYIPGATAVIDGKLMRSNPVAVQVIDHQSLNDPAPPDSLTVIDQSEIRPGETIAKKVRENFFLSGETNKTTCYVGEPMMAVYKACTRLNSTSQVVKRPSFTGFSVIEMVDSYDARPIVERIHGKPFYVHLIRKVQLFPLQPGTYELDNAEVESAIHFVKSGNGSAADELGRLFDPSPNDENKYITHNLTLKTEPITITVKPLPDTGQPPDFSGAVGNFTIDAHTNQTTATTGSQVNVQFVINGSGNFPLVTAPQMKWPQNVEVSNAVVKEKTNPYAFPLSGYKSFEYSIVPRDTGTIVIPSASFSYFDAQHKAYRTVRTTPISINVKKGARDASRSNPEYVFNSRPAIPLHYYWFGLVVIVIAGWIVYQLFSNRSSAPEKHVEVEKPTETKIITTNDYFVIASLAIMKNDQKRFYTEVQRVLWELAASKSSVAPSELNKRNVTYQLRQASVPEDIIRDLVQIIDECEWLLYTPNATGQDMDTMLEKAKVIFERLQTA